MSDQLVLLEFIGVPLDLGGQNLGVDIGPQAFRDHNIIEKLEHSGFKVTDSGNIECANRSSLKPGNPRLRYLNEIIRVSEKTAKLSEAAIKEGRRVLAVGGDHSICLGVVSGASAALGDNLGLIYLDAHGDMNTESTTLTGNIHGMHLASLMGFGTASLASLYNQKVPKISKRNLLHIGGCDFDQAELDLIKQEDLRTFTLLDLLSKNMSPLFSMIEDLSKRTPNVWVSLDLDSIDAVYAPGVGMPNKKGLTYREIVTIADFIGTHCNIVGVDVVEYNPLQDIDHKTAELSIELIAKLFGKEYSWYQGYLEKNKIN